MGGRTAQLLWVVGLRLMPPLYKERFRFEIAGNRNRPHPNFLWKRFPESIVSQGIQAAPSSRASAVLPFLFQIACGQRPGPISRHIVLFLQVSHDVIGFLL